MPALGLGLGLDKSQGLILAPEAVSWAAAVVAAGSSVPASVVFSVSEFVKGCQADASPNAGVNNWTAMKSVQLLAGPATFAGISAPLKGAAPTFFNFVGGDYDPATGLKGDGVNKYASLNRSSSADPQNNFSMWIVLSESPAAGIPQGIITSSTGVGGSRIAKSTANALLMNSRRNSSTVAATQASYTGFVGHSRAESGSFNYRVNGVTGNATGESETPIDSTIISFANASSPVDTFSVQRASAVGAGEAVDLGLLDTRFATLMAAISAAHAP